MSLSKLRTRSMGIGAAIVASVLVLGAYGGAAYASDSVSTPDPATSAVATDAKAKVVDEGDSKPADGVDDKAQARDVVVSDTSEGEAKVDDTSVDTDSNTNAEDTTKVDNEAANPADSKPADVTEQAPITDPVSQTGPSVQAPVEQGPAVEAEEPWVPKSVLKLTQTPCELHDDKQNVDYDRSGLDPSEHIQGRVRIEGVDTQGDSTIFLPEGVYNYEYTVVRNSTGESKDVKSPTPLVIKSCVVDPIEAPAPTQETGSPDVIIPVKEGVTYYNVTTNVVVTGTVTLADKETIKIGAKPSGNVPVVGGPWQFSYTAPVVCQSNLDGRTGTYTHTDNESTYTVFIPKPACADLKAGFGDTYTLPAGYDGSGAFNGSASPQQFIPSARAELVIAKGQTSVTVTKSFASALVCGVVNHLQGDTYGGPQQDVVTFPQGSNNFLAGGIFKVQGADCYTYIDVPAQPAIIDECGPNNATWAPYEVPPGVIVTKNPDNGSLTFAPDVDKGYRFKGEVQEVTYLLVDSNEACPVVVPPTTPPTTPPVTPVAPQPTSEPTHTSVPATLAVTGGSDASLTFFGIGGAVMLAIGLGGIVLAAVRRRQSQSSQAD